ncbi:MAG: hypothetical protein NTY48_02540, partial [Candidatus Diapherotrites archaeon]|nr:hypothetical protein [Candidatus Diapherotrites archaeon]
MDLIFMEFLYIFYILGSFSAGYAVIRAGFPSFQEASNFTKLLWGYILGALIFIFAARLVYFSGFNEKHFFFASAFIFMLVFIAFFTNRVLNKEKD